jgi:hypothetical protein
LCAGVRRSSARASILDQRRSSVVSDTQESPEKIRDADNMNKSFGIDFEDGDLQQEELTCSSCLSTHCDMEQPLSFLWLESFGIETYSCLIQGKTAESTLSVKISTSCPFIS